MESPASQLEIAPVPTMQNAGETIVHERPALGVPWEMKMRLIQRSIWRWHTAFLKSPLTPPSAAVPSPAGVRGYAAKIPKVRAPAALLAARHESPSGFSGPRR